MAKRKVLINVLSLAQVVDDVEKDKRTLSYAFPDGNGSVRGYQTNEAVTKYLLQTKALNEIICIASPQSLGIDGDNPASQTAFDYYLNGIQEFLNILGGFAAITISYYGCPDSLTDYTVSIGAQASQVEGALTLKIHMILKETTETTEMLKTMGAIKQLLDQDTDVFLDTTGGPRDTASMLLLFQRIMEFNSIKLEGAYYSEYVRDNSQGSRIINITDTYRLFDLISGIREFESTGSVNTLTDRFEPESRELDSIVKDLGEYSEGMTLGNLSEPSIVARMYELTQGINKKVKAIDSSAFQKSGDMLFLLALPAIGENFGFSSDDKLFAINIIEWCLEHGHIHRATILYTDLIPKLLADCGYFELNDELRNYYNKKKDGKDAKYKIASNNEKVPEQFTKLLGGVGIGGLYSSLDIKELIRKRTGYSSSWDFSEMRITALEYLAIKKIRNFLSHIEDGDSDKDNRILLADYLGDCLKNGEGKKAVRNKIKHHLDSVDEQYDISKYTGIKIRQLLEESIARLKDRLNDNTIRK